MSDSDSGGSDWAGARTLASEDVEDTAQGNDTSLGDRLRKKLKGGSHTPPRVGRFFIQTELGTGGMGTVFSGLDPELDRKVAVKLVHHDATSERARLRLRREAQALAQLSHPNVVPVFEVGEHEGHTFLAMELVDGVDLSHWLAERRRSWRGVLDKFIQAGKGLAAAHDVGLVHRDFKPHNVLVGKDGRVRVVDFGLATDEFVAPTPVDPLESGPVSGSLTRTGELLGTPAFMSPEQFSGGQVGPASDQFSFCSALFQALAGHRPFVGDCVADLASAVLRDEPAALPSGPYPDGLGPVLARGMAREPKRRHASMKRLLFELRTLVGQAPPQRSRATLVLGSATVVLASALVWVAVSPDDAGSDADPNRAAVQDADASPAKAPAAADRTTVPPAAVEPPDAAVAPPPQGEPPAFADVSGARAREAIEQYQAGCRHYAAGEFRTATQRFGEAAAAYARAQGNAQDAARIEYARALAHLAAFERDGHANDLRVAYELLRRIYRDGGIPGEHPSPPGVARADETTRGAVLAYEQLAQRPELAPAGIDPEAPTKFALAWFDEGEPGTEVSIDNEIIGHQPCTGAVILDQGGHTIITRHPAFYDTFSMWNPRDISNRRLRTQQSAVPRGRDRNNQQPYPMPGLVDLPDEISGPDDWPK